MWILALIFIVPLVFLWIAYEVVVFLAWMIIEFCVTVAEWLRGRRPAL